MNVIARLERVIDEAEIEIDGLYTQMRDIQERIDAHHNTIITIEKAKLLVELGEETIKIQTGAV